ncbi:related to MFS sugar transporter [Phialocephala subalpina]|uniref:Related to MFS sugar transporter n=1 Tax=Phialocephala subalpina TaxID=576137 RepID=A0A1L7XU05_9HELO|nr:related to MFS sugar transporter [Phialocephala subalpina]
MASKTASDVEHVPVRERSFSAPTQVVEQQSWLERTLKPNKVTARYPIKGSPLLYATCTFGSLGIMSGLLVNPVFISRFYKDYGGADSTTDCINPAITGISVACLQASAAVGALVAGRLGDIIGRKKCVRIGGFIYSFSAFIQMFAPGFVTFVTGRTIQGIGVGFLSETPRWLAKNGFWKESLQTIADLHSRGDTQAEHVQKIFLEIQDAVKYEENLGKSGWTRTIVGITVQMFAQLNGINIISFYLPSTLASAGFDNHKLLLYTAINALPYTGATVVSWYLADRWGRKPLLILGGLGMAGLLGVVCAFTQADLAIHTKAYGQYAFVMLYNIVYGFTWGPMPWLLPAGIFPLRGRSKGFCLFSAGLTHCYYVETANHTLEEIAVAFGDKAYEGSRDEIMLE